MLNRIKSMKWGIVLLVLLLGLLPLFQNCNLQKGMSTQMALPDDIQTVAPSLKSFDERTGIFQNYSLEVDVESGGVAAIFSNDTSSATGPIVDVKSCQFFLKLTSEQLKEFKNIVGRVLICRGIEEVDAESCAGSCPTRNYMFESRGLNFHVSLKNSGKGSLYFCGGEDQLKLYLLNLVKANLQINCPSDYDQLLQ